MAQKGMQGIVVAQAGDRVKVRVFRNNTCEDCDCVLQDACDPDQPPQGRRGMFDFFADRSALELDAVNAAGAAIGDRILLNIRDERSVIKGAILVYLLPGFLFLAGLFSGGWLAKRWWLATGDQEILAQLLGGVAMLLFAYLGVKLYLGIKGTDEYVPHVTQVLRQATPDHVIHRLPTP